jgi:hypothetical protein
MSSEQENFAKMNEALKAIHDALRPLTQDERRRIIMAVAVLYEVEDVRGVRRG